MTDREMDRPAAPDPDFRHQVAAALRNRGPAIAGDAAAVLSRTAAGAEDGEYGRRLADAALQLLTAAVGDGRVDPRGSLAADLRSLIAERATPPDHLFTLVYIVERTALDDLAIDPAMGATTEAWPLAAQLVRRASFDALAALTSRIDDAAAALVDPLTTLYSRAMFDIVIAKELDRAARFGDSVALILFDVDGLRSLNEQHGRGVGDRVLERIGILVRRYFRQNDWVCRAGDDTIAVLLTRGDAEHAPALAESVRATVAERLGVSDFRSGELVRVTVSGAVARVQAGTDAAVDTERLVTAAEGALQAAKRRGRNCIETVAVEAPSRTLLRNSPSA